ncbi:polysaccharide deacetylase family protein [Thalassotalea crassostreae]|uniref:polysaccharide deacetylase family protein n=1 Tax=Thalassotalea crassostreae TaxID=1763536 RepID=UPI000839364D|nr:polysaccharide deacetylase family protein [Thalassotalea crassostreae]
MTSSVIKYFIPNKILAFKESRASKDIYLTFDDGPTPIVTEQLLSLLSKYNIKATFFMIGSNIEKHPEIAKSVVDNGHSIGNHSLTHKEFPSLSFKQQVIEVEQTNKLIDSLKAFNKKLFRVPRGKWTIFILFYCFISKIRAIHWSLDSNDYQKSSINSLINRLKNQPLKNGEIILFHDDHNLSIEILEVMIPIWLDANFKFRTLS